MDNNFFVKLQKTWFYNKEEETLLEKYGSIGFTVYSILIRNVTTRNTVPICINTIANIILGENKKNNSRFIKKIKESILKMNNDLFTIYNNSNCSNPTDVDKFNNTSTYYGSIVPSTEKNGFMMLYDKEIDKLIEYARGKKISIEDLIVHYGFICNGLKGKKKEEVKDPEGLKCWYGSLESITKKIGLNKNNLINNNKIFIKENLLLIDNAGAKVSGKDEFENTSNIYARVEDKEYFNKYLEIRKGKVKKSYAAKSEKEGQDHQRKLKMLYKTYQKKNNIFDRGDIEDIEVFNKLQKMELDYLNFARSRGRKPEKLIDTNYKTIKRDGTPYKFYTGDTDELEDLDEIVPEGYRARDNDEHNKKDNVIDYDYLKENVNPFKHKGLGRSGLKIDKNFESEAYKKNDDTYNDDYDKEFENFIQNI